MRSMLLNPITFGIIASVLWSSSCAMTRRQSTSPPPQAISSPSPAATSDVAEELAKAQDYIGRALNELRNRNSRGALELIDMAGKSLGQATSNASAATKTAIETAAQNLESAKILIEKKKDAENALLKVEQTVSSLVDQATKMADQMKEKVANAATVVKDAISVTPTQPLKTPATRKR